MKLEYPNFYNFEKLLLNNNELLLLKGKKERRASSIMCVAPGKYIMRRSRI